MELPSTPAFIGLGRPGRHACGPMPGAVVRLLLAGDLDLHGAGAVREAALIVAGGLVGIALASLLVATCRPSDVATVVLLAFLAAAAYALCFASYALSSGLLTVLVALVVELGGGSPIGALGDRLIDTAAGAVIALAAITVARPQAAWTWRLRSRPARSSVAAYGRRGGNAG